MFRPRGFSPPRRLAPRSLCGFVAPRCRSWDSPRFAAPDVSVAPPRNAADPSKSSCRQPCPCHPVRARERTLAGSPRAVAPLALFTATHRLFPRPKAGNPTPEPIRGGSGPARRRRLPDRSDPRVQGARAHLPVPDPDSHRGGATRRPRRFTVPRHRSDVTRRLPPPALRRPPWLGRCNGRSRRRGPAPRAPDDPWRARNLATVAQPTAASPVKSELRTTRPSTGASQPLQEACAVGQPRGDDP